jgi:hypothetical protein
MHKPLCLHTTWMILTILMMIVCLQSSSNCQNAQATVSAYNLDDSDSGYLETKQSSVWLFFLVYSWNIAVTAFNKNLKCSLCVTSSYACTPECADFASKLIQPVLLGYYIMLDDIIEVYSILAAPWINWSGPKPCYETHAYFTNTAA